MPLTVNSCPCSERDHLRRGSLLISAYFTTSSWVSDRNVYSLLSTSAGKRGFLGGMAGGGQTFGYLLVGLEARLVEEMPDQGAECLPEPSARGGLVEKEGDYLG